MKLKSLLLGTALTAAFAVTADAAASNRGWYVGAEAGANWVQDVDDSVSFFGVPVTTLDVDFDTGWVAIASVGYAFWDSNWRVELEGAYRSNDIASATTAGGGTVDGGGADFSEASLMVNALYDIPLTSRLTLSVGAGAGVAYAHLDAPNAVIPVDDHDWNFAWQAIAGLSYAVTDRLDLTLNYRYHRIEDGPEFTTLGFVGNDFDNTENHTVTVGLRWDLYPDEAPPAPRAPEPPPAPVAAPREFIIFFAFNKANLTPEAHRVVQEAAAAAKQYGSARILVTGHTDTSGSQAYNMRLSLRRAAAAKAGLVSEGISPSSITTNGKGETELLVQTADGVKEPQNRRAVMELD